MSRPNTSYFVALGVFCASATAGAQTLTTSELPIVEIALPHDSIPDEPKAITRLRIVDNGPGAVNRAGGPTRGYVGLAGVERRGSTSQTLFPKIGYGLELRTAAGADTSAVVLGMPREEDWVLHGPYSDKTLIRNAFAYGLAADLMDYAPRSRFVELVVGGDYRGVYLLTERIKRDGDRVDVARMEPDDLTGVALTGGYIVKIDKFTGESTGPGLINGFELPPVGLPGARPTKILHHYPRPRDIAPAQSAYIQGVLRDFETRLASANMDDPETGYVPLVDLESFVDYLLVNEVTRNVDAYRLSTYLSKDRDDGPGGGRLRMGPVWDFNLALANAAYCNAPEAEGWAYAFNGYCPEDFFYAPFWYERLSTSRPFLDVLAARYAALRQNGLLSDERLFARFDSLAAAVPPAAVDRNFERWPVLGEYTWPNAYVPNSREDALRHARAWLGRRMAWMDGAIDRLSAPPPTSAPGTLEAAFGPNPGYADAKLHGVLPESFPLEVTWLDHAGRRLARYTATAIEEVRVPPAAGFFVFELVASNGATTRGRFAGLGARD